MKSNDYVPPVAVVVAKAHSLAILVRKRNWEQPFCSYGGRGGACNGGDQIRTWKNPSFDHNHFPVARCALRVATCFSLVLGTARFHVHINFSVEF